MILSELIHKIEEAAKLKKPVEGDNSGLIVGDATADVTKVLLALDCTQAIIDEAKNHGAQLIFTHHPPIYDPIKSILPNTPVGAKITSLIKNDIALYAAHSSLDLSSIGTTATLCEILALYDSVLTSDGMGAVGTLDEPISLVNFTLRLAWLLKCPPIRFCGKSLKEVKKVGVCAGAGATYKSIAEMKERGADVYVTSDITFHMAQYALDLGLAMIDVTHYASENPVMARLHKRFTEKIPEVEFSSSLVNGEVFKSINKNTGVLIS
ncbi:GTP cyclohydrolase 1 type 2 [Clostridia bacterium]|nr:GTP cyclohydrolase 1 type 2 [Clostridia bacterium]